MGHKIPPLIPKTERNSNSEDNRNIDRAEDEPGEHPGGPLSLKKLPGFADPLETHLAGYSIIGLIQRNVSLPVSAGNTAPFSQQNGRFPSLARLPEDTLLVAPCGKANVNYPPEIIWAKSRT